VPLPVPNPTAVTVASLMPPAPVRVSWQRGGLSRSLPPATWFAWWATRSDAARFPIVTHEPVPAALMHTRILPVDVFV
jgi:hypothetical protein